MDATPLTSMNFPCNTCELTFENSQAQRKHMREPWHVYNVKRRISSLPPISAKAYADNVATIVVASRRDTKNPYYPTVAQSVPEAECAEDVDHDSSSINEEFGPERCLFCSSISKDLDSNFEHMAREHGLYLPQIEYLSSLEVTVRYLRTIIDEYNECLYCGLTKRSAHGVRQHMIEKGHCMVNLEREPELLEFWDFSDSDEHASDDDNKELAADIENSTENQDQHPSHAEFILPSGRVVESKNEARESRRLARRTARAAKESDKQIQPVDELLDDPMSSTTTTSNEIIARRDGADSNDQSIARRDAAGLVGVSSQQFRNLANLQRKAQRQQDIMRAMAPWGAEKGGVHQKHSKQKMNLAGG